VTLGNGELSAKNVRFALDSEPNSGYDVITAKVRDGRSGQVYPLV